MMMMADKFDLQSFLARPDGVAALMSASDLFGLLKRSFDLPASWAALVTRETGDHTVVQPGAVVSSDDADDVLFVRTSPIDVRLTEEGVATKDRFQCRVDVQLRLSIVPERSELQSFRGAILGSRRVTTAADIARYLEPAIRSALLRFAADREVADLVDAEATEPSSAVVADAIEGPCFTAGLTVDGEGNIYVADWGNERVKVLGPDGTLIASLRGGSVDSKWAADYFAVNPEEGRLRYEADLFPELDPPYRRDREISAGVEGFFWGPTAVKLDGKGHLYVADSLRHRLQIYQID
ncbi:MAG: hypothetical protein IIB89_04375 [Chloroflexi bacterium]|nr:hypothetical protein [Chloroflexota bacterium]